MSVLSTIVNDVKAEILKIESWIKGVDWSTVAADFQKVITELESVVAPVIEALFPGTKSTINEVVTPVLNNAKTAVAALTDVAEQYAGGNLSSTALTQAAQTVQAAVVAAAAVVSAATAKPAPVAVANVAAGGTIAPTAS